MLKKFRGNTIGVLFLLLVGTGIAFTPSSATARQLLHGHVPAAVGQWHLQPTGRLPATTRLTLAIGLPLRNGAALGDLLTQLYDPNSPDFRHYLTPDQFAEQFGPAPGDYDALIQFATTNGLSVTGTCTDRTLLDVSGTVADIERVFHVTMRTYRHPTENRDFFAPDVEPSVDFAIPILHITGLDNFVRPRPLIHKMAPRSRGSAVKPAFGTAPTGLFMGSDFRNAYVPGVPLNGSNQIAGVLELEGYYKSDITSYESMAGLPNITLSNELVDTSGAPGSDDTEVVADIDMIISMATNLTKVIVYECPNPPGATDVLTLLGKMATDDLAKQISSSWIVPDDANYDVEYQKFATQGQSYFQASGDLGAYYPGISQSLDDTNITIVGGTTLSTTGPGGPYAAETVWNENTSGEGTGGSGGGTNIAGTRIPSWQTNINMTANHGSTKLRNVPDVAMSADVTYVVADEGQYEGPVDGTSLAAPLWAGFTALINQQAAANGKATVGFINPAVYAIGKSPYYTYLFYDITVGNNTNSTVTTNYPAVPGYDLCTGWGTPNGPKLITALATPDSLGVLPGMGFTAYGPLGGPFNISTETFTVTNSGTSALNWAAAGPAWLSIAPASGALPAKSSVPVTVSLNSTVNGLAPATYTANVAFTNVTSKIVQTCLFTLQLGQSLVQNGGFETSDFSLWTFNGESFDFQGDLIDYVVGVDTFGNSATNWVHSGQFGAAFGENDGLAYISQALPTKVGQSYLLSFWLNNIYSGAPNELVVNWNPNADTTNNIFEETNVPVLEDWTNMLFIVSASTTNTVLQFGLENDYLEGLFFGLDDISVQPVPAPSFRAVARANNAIQFTWNSLAGVTYQLQYSTNLDSGNWMNLGPPGPAAGYTLSATNSIGPDMRRFYRVQWVN